MDFSSFSHFTKFSDFDAIPYLVVIEDVETRTIVYTNSAYKKAVEGFGGALPTFDKRFVSIDTEHMVIEGKLRAVEVARSVLPVEKSFYNNTLRLTISDIQNIVRTEVNTDFLTSENGRNYHDKLIEGMIRKLMEYYEMKYTHLFVFQGSPKVPGVLHQFFLDGDKFTSKSYESVLNDYWANSLDTFFGVGYSLFCEDMKGFAPFDESLYKRLTDRKIETIVIIPFFAESKLIGLLSIANPKKIDDVTDMFLADFVTNSIGSMIYRGKLYATMYFDEVTGFPWSSAIEYFYPRFLEANKDIPISICEFDFLHARTITSTYGAEKRDEIYKATAAILRDKYPNAIVARKNGSDNFIVITTGVAENLAIEANKIVEELHAIFSEILITLVFGIYQVKNREEKLDYSLLKASFAHNYAKNDPFGRIKVFDEKMGESESRNLFFINRFRDSLAKEDFKVFIQPKYDLETKHYCGGEALVRWFLDGKFVPPDEFIPLFEASGICHELDLYILRKTCEIIKSWLDKDPESALPISVNFSRVDFADPNLFEKILFVVRDVGVPADYVEIEITESAYVDYEPQIISFLTKCHAAGIRVLMDDFGSGVSSFSSLKNLNVDILKLDYKFLSFGGDNAKKKKIIEGIVSLARTIGTPVIVEGVETNEEASFFHSLGVRFLQGFLFGKPMPLEEFNKIKNREAIFQITEVADDRMLYHDLLDRASNTSLLFNELDLLQGIFRFDGKGLYPVVLNKRLEESISTVSLISTFLQSDLLSFVSGGVKKEAIACLSGDHTPYAFTAKHRVVFNFGTNQYPIFLSSMFIKKDSSGSEYYLFQGTSAYRSSDRFAHEITNVDLEDILRSAVHGCVITNEQGYILKFNDYIYQYFPKVEVGKHLSAVFGNEITNASTLRRIYHIDKGSVFEVTGREGRYAGNPSFALVFNNLGKPNSHVCELSGNGFKFYDRMLATISKVALSYVEIDLDEDYFMEIHLDERHAELYGATFQTGKYSTELYERFHKNARSEDLPMIEERFAFSKLIDAGRAMSPFSVTYKIKGKNEFHRIETKFYYDLGHHYVCFFLEDVTESQIRDFDLLTGCLGRTAGSRIITNYISNHLLDKMAFVILDIDHFKDLNDTYGHPMGDRVLAKVNDAFKKLPDRYIYATRFGGDEFAVLVKERPDDYSPDKIREEIGLVFKNIGYEVGINREISISAGVALIPENGGRVEMLYPIADSDLYEQKRLKKLKR